MNRFGVPMLSQNELSVCFVVKFVDHHLLIIRLSHYQTVWLVFLLLYDCVCVFAVVWKIVGIPSIVFLRE